MKRIISILFVLSLGVSACTPSSTPTPPIILTDSFFSGYAFVDTNGNAQIDAADTPVKDAIFIVRLNDGTEFGGTTDETGNAFVIIPASVEYPVTLVMKQPTNSTLRLIGPSEIVLQGVTGEKATFLFAPD